MALESGIGIGSTLEWNLDRLGLFLLASWCVVVFSRFAES